MEKNFNKGPFSVGEKKIESTWVFLNKSHTKFKFGICTNIWVLLFGIFGICTNSETPNN
jgi:hypothetical protein